MATRIGPVPPPQHFDQIATLASEHEQVAAEGIGSNTVWTFAAKLLKPERMSVTPAASQTFVRLGSPIMLPIPT